MLVTNYLSFFINSLLPGLPSLWALRIVKVRDQSVDFMYEWDEFSSLFCKHMFFIAVVKVQGVEALSECVLSA